MTLTADEAHKHVDRVLGRLIERGIDSVAASMGILEEKTPDVLLAKIEKQAKSSSDPTMTSAYGALLLTGTIKNWDNCKGDNLLAGMEWIQKAAEGDDSLAVECCLYMHIYVDLTVNAHKQTGIFGWIKKLLRIDIR